MASLTKRAKRAARRAAWTGVRAVSSVLPRSWRARATPHARYLDMLLLDHLFIRLMFPNRHRLSEETWRAAQPLPHQIRDLKRRGIRTIVNLRGRTRSSTYVFERAASRKAGLNLVDFRVRSRAAPTRAEVLAARDLFANVEYPMLMHCKSGADRVGLMSVLYLHTRHGAPISDARRQLSLRYGHIRQADTGILDLFFDSYLAYAEKTPIAFYEWVATVYDPADVASHLHSRRWANRVVDKIFKRE
ncbi:sulfur transferase domain-containing protein [Hyphomicrobium sp. CS1GBMeth3]|uniref:fused DSP-PTPase phosphatase/NAD kinase-like protein n=1 Tax=Hyphomicrobium sp. CS1GBMeth3 TaxID=1892845 RepID=UPI000931F3A8|nr:sulfur transferase domain-containing protein [Hyphomicrobium sp. CS1GBMeth3]